MRRRGFLAAIAAVVAAPWVTLLWPHLCDPKRQQAERCWEKLRALAGRKSPKLPDLPEAA